MFTQHSTGPSRESIQVPVAKHLRALWRAGVVAACAAILINLWAIAAGPQEGERYWFVLNAEASPAAWLNGAMFLVGAALAGAIALVDDPGTRRFWVLFSLALVAMSFDEIATVHERIGGNLPDTSSDMPYLWVIPGSLVALAIGMVLWHWRPVPAPASWRLLACGALLFLVGAVGLELVGAYVRETGASEWDASYLMVTTVEEALELVGTLLALHGLIDQFEHLDARLVASPMRPS